MKTLKATAIGLFALGLLALCLHYSIVPLVPVSERLSLSQMTEEADGLLSADLALPWPLKVSKLGTSAITAELEDGTRLSHYRSRAALLGADSQQGFYINRPQVFIQVPASMKSAMKSAPDVGVKLLIPVRLRDIFHKVFFSLAFALCVVIGLRGGMAWIVGLSTAAVAIGLWLLFAMRGVFVWIGFGLVCAALIGALTALRATGDIEANKRARILRSAANALLVAGVTFLCLALAEGYLTYAGQGSRAPVSAEATDASDASVASTPDRTWFQLPRDVVATAMSRSAALTMPEEWERVPIEVNNATSAYRWHGAPHVRDINGFRRLNGPFASKRPETFRIMVVGDSLTFGEGIAAEWTFSQLLENALQASYDAEVMNLGVGGYQSDDILKVVEIFLPQIQPDLLIYAVCLNDFLSSGQRQQSNISFPLPEDWKEYLLERSTLAKLVSDSYHSLLLMTGLKTDFYDDILSQDSGFRERFADDVMAMSRFAQERGLPRVIGIVFHQDFSGDERPWELIDTAETSLAAANFDLISIKPWRSWIDGRRFPVSRWEGHPNELAHSLVAEAIYERLLDRGYLEGYARTPSSD